MASLYELSSAFLACERIGDEVVDTNTGEVLDTEYLDNLQMAREEKLESCACYVKNIESDIVAFKAEISRLTEVKRMMEKKVERMRRYIADNMTQGEKLTTPKCSISWHKSEVLEVSEGVDMDVIPTEAIKYKVPEIDKVVLKRLVKDGLTIDGVELVTKNNLQLK